MSELTDDPYLNRISYLAREMRELAEQLIKLSNVVNSINRELASVKRELDYHKMYEHDR